MRAPDILILARSGRQLAEAARAAGYCPVVVDLFGDADTAAACVTSVALAPATGFAFDPAVLMSTLAELRRNYGAMPVVWGSGWETQPHLLAAIAASWPLTGCPVSALFAANDPARLTGVLDSTGIAPPESVYGRRPAYGEWLLKRRGSCGGYGVQDAGSREFAGQREFFQRKAFGVPLSGVFFAGSGAVTLLGVCAAFDLQPQRDFPYRFSAAVGAPEHEAVCRRRVHELAEMLTEAFGLRGLCGVDFMYADRGALSLVELNARPPATFGLLAEPAAALRAHVEGDPAMLLPRAPEAEVRAMGVCYAEDPIALPKALNWPAWVADRPFPGDRIEAGMPICSVTASAASAADARVLLAQRFDELMMLVSGMPQIAKNRYALRRT